MGREKKITIFSEVYAMTVHAPSLHHRSLADVLDYIFQRMQQVEQEIFVLLKEKGSSFSAKQREKNASWLLGCSLNRELHLISRTHEE